MFASAWRLRLAVATPGLGALAGCRVPLRVNHKPGQAPRCTDGICLEVVWLDTAGTTIGFWIDAPANTRLLNARVSDTPDEPCRRGYAITWATVDTKVLHNGPADVTGAHGVVVGLPYNTWGRYWAATALDVELAVAGQRRCLRHPLTLPDGKLALQP